MKKFYLLLLVALLLPAFAWGQQLFSGGDGSEGNPYKIANEQDLNTLSKMVADKANNSFEGKYFTQTADIHLTGENFTPIGGNATELVPNWEKESFFNGVYDGGMHKIYNLNIHTEEQLLMDGDEWNGARFRVALFGAIGGKAVIKNVVVASGHIYGAAHTATIVGWMREGALVSHCKVGNKVHLFSRYVAGGVVAAALKNTTVEKCVNYGNVRSYGNAAFTGVAGGIIASPSDTKVEGCANFGDVYSATSFVGGIVGLYPLTRPDGQEFNYVYPPMQSCMNAGDVSSQTGVAAGLAGSWPYAPAVSTENGRTAGEKIALKNCYSYGQAYVATKKTFGPIIGFVQRQFPQKSEKTYYNADRFFFKVDPNSTDSEIAFLHGESKTHADMRSNAFIAEINEGSLHLFEEDKHGINYGMPVLKWINDSYDAEIDVPIYMEKNLTPSVFKEKAGTFFRPNRRGEFIMVNKDMQTPNIQMKSLGHSIYRAWAYRIFPIKGETKYRFFNSTSRFRRPFNEDGSVNVQNEPNAAAHWLITPEFEVTKEKPFFVWKAGSENEVLKEGYKVYIGDASATSPEHFKDAPLLFETQGEDVMVEVPESAYEEAHYKFRHRAVDLKAYIGKKVRLAFVDDTKYGFSLMLGQFNVAETEKEIAIEEILPSDLYTLRMEGTTLLAETQGENLYFELYDMTGQRVAIAENNLVYTATKGVYVLKIQDSLKRTQVRKIII